MRKKLDEQLAALNENMISMGALCENAIRLTSESLSMHNSDLKEMTASIDEDIQQLERNIESLCLKLLLQQQPVAGDLRQISAALKMITDLRRIGEQANDIASILIRVPMGISEECALIKGMAQASIRMVTESLDAFVRQDIEIAQKAIEHDDIVDDYFHKVKKSLIELIAAHPEEGESALALLMAAKYYERIGDHAANIAGWVIFSVTGVHREQAV